MSLREWQVKTMLEKLWLDYANTGSQITYRRILRKEREKKQLNKDRRAA